MPSETVPLVGVTGGIGSGKSEVCRRFGALGRTVLSADQLARELTEKDPAVGEAIRKTFGAGIYGPDGSLRRRELAEVVFSAPSKRRALDAIVHPRVFSELATAVQALPPAARLPYVIVEAALVFESGMDAFLAATVVVRAAEETRIARVMMRDGVTREEVIARMQAQMSPEEKAKRGDFIIDNDGPTEGILAKVAFIDRILALFVRSSPRP